MSIFPSSLRNLRRRIVVSALAAAVLPFAAACATDVLARPAAVELSVIDRDSGQALAVHRKDGRSYVAGVPQARYSLRLINRSPRRQLIVLSVDGVNVISGETAAWDQVGYVLGPWQSSEISGWRKSDSQVAAFEFAALHDSYAARTNRPDNVGVIGMAVFAEKPAPAVSRRPSGPPAQLGSAAPADAEKAAAERRSESAGDTLGAADAAKSSLAQGQRLGTAHGQREWSAATRTRFERHSQTPDLLVEIAYDSFANLLAAGIIRSDVAQSRPRAFPMNDERLGRFVADPPPR